MAARFFARRTRKEVSTAAKSEEPIQKQTFEGHEGNIWDFVFLHDNVHIVSGSLDGTMRKWNCDTGLLVGKPWRGEGGGIRALALSPDGNMIACGRDDGSVQRWNTDGEMIAGVWTGHSDSVGSLSWSPSGDHIASGSFDGTILIRKAESGQVEAICIWDTTTGKLVVGPIKDLGDSVTSMVWSSDSTKLYSASDEFARVFNSKSGELLHQFKHDELLYSVALSPKHNVLACVGNGIATVWDIESLQPLDQPFSRDDGWLNHVSFSPDGHHLAYGGDNKKLTLWSVGDIAPQLKAPILLQQSDRQSIQQETRPNSPSSSCLDADATGGDGIIKEGNDDPYNNFFQTSHQSLPSATPGSHLHRLFSPRRFFKVLSRHHPPAGEPVPKERPKRKFFTRRTPSNTSLELATMKANQPVSEGKVGEGNGEQGDNDRGSPNDPLNARNDKGKHSDEPPTDAQIPPSDDPIHPEELDSKGNRNLWKRMMHTRGKNTIFSSLDFSTRPTNPPQPIPRRPWDWNSNLTVGSSRRPVDVAACRDEDRYGIVPESDAEAAAAMLRTSGNEVDSPTRPGQPAVGAQVSHGQPTQTQALASGPEENVYEGVSCCGFFFGCRRRSNLHQP